MPEASLNCYPMVCCCCRCLQSHSISAATFVNSSSLGAYCNFLFARPEETPTTFVSHTETETEKGAADIDAKEFLSWLHTESSPAGNVNLNRQRPRPTFAFDVCLYVSFVLYILVCISGLKQLLSDSNGSLKHYVFRTIADRPRPEAL